MFISYMHDQRITKGSPLSRKNTLQCCRLKSVGTKAVYSLSRKNDKLTIMQQFCSTLNHRRLRVFSINLNDFRTYICHKNPFRVPSCLHLREERKAPAGAHAASTRSRQFVGARGNTSCQHR